MRNRKPANAHMPVTAVSTAPENGSERKNRRSISGSAARRDQAIRVASAAAATAKQAMIGAEPQPRSGPSMMP